MKIYTSLLLILILAFQSATAQTKAAKSPDKNKTVWQQIDSLKNKGLPKSALKEVNIIYYQSLKSKNTNDFIKSLIYQFELQNQVEDISLDEMVEKMENDLVDLWEPAQQLMHHFLADLYKSHLQNNKWKLLSQKEVSTGSHLITEMSYQELSDKIIEHLFASLENKKLLQSERLEKYEPLLSKQLKKLPSRPTLYDLIVLEASETLLSGELFTLPGEENYPFSDTLLLANFENFLTLQIPSEYAETPEAKGLELLKEWLSFRKNDSNREAFYDADLNRLLWMKNKYNEEDAFDRMDEALTHLAEKSKATPIQSSVLFHQAQLYFHLPNAENPNSLVKAYQLAEQAKKSHPKSEGAQLAQNLQSEITKPEISAIGEEAISTKSPFIYLLSYKNSKKVHVYLYALNQPDMKILNPNSYYNYKKELEKLTPIQSKTVLLPEYKDYITHSAELCLEMPEKSGKYVLLITLEPFNGLFEKTKVFETIPFQITDLSYLIRPQGETNQLITVLNSTSGEPIEGVEVSTFNNIYRTTNTKVINQPTTDERGQSELKFSTFNGNFTIALSKGKDHYYSDHRWWAYQRDKTDKAMQTKHFIFTDRGIYRPGQTIHFKGIAMESNGDSARTMSRQTLNIKLLDVNGRELSTQQLTTNEYGSVSGSLVLPTQVLTGSFTLQSAHGSTNVFIEEYKRPKMEVTFSPFTEIKMVGDSITIKAMSKGYSGFPIQNAKVAWKVERTASLWRWYPSRSTLLTSGTTQTNELGEVSIIFKAAVDKKMPKETPHTFNITMDVTAPNGETQSASQTIVLGNKSVQAQVKIAPLTLDPSTKGIPVSIEINNLSGEQVKSEVRYILSRLKNRGVSNTYRYWDEPDTLLCTSSPFTSSKRNWRNYPIEREMNNDTLWIDGTRSFTLPIELSGIYRLDVVTQQTSGENDTTSTSFKVVKSKDRNYNLDEALTLLVKEKEVKPGDTLHIMMGSAFEDANILLNVSYDGNTLHDETRTTQKEWNHITYVVPKDLIGNVNIQVALVKNNRYYEQVAVVNIQDPAKKLNLSLSSFRDKTTPGSKEEWQLTLKDGDKKPVKAEILALMYDASLDAYAANSLFMNPFSNYKSSNNWISKGFGTVRGNGMNQISFPYLNPADYPSFFWTGQSYYYFGRGYPLMIMKSARTESIQFSEESTPTLTGSLTTIKDEDSEDLFSQKEEISPTPTLTKDTPTFEVRKNLQETAFFFPFLQSDSLGEATFNFTMPESLTRWRFMALAHRKDGQSANTEEMITTSKQLMVVPNLPRVVRHGDELVFNTTIVNNSENTLSGTAFLTIKDVVTEKEIPLNQPKWEADAGKSTQAEWRVTIPDDVNLLEVTIGAKSPNLSDGETHFIPVLSSKTLVTETLPITLNNKGKHTFEMKELTSGKKGQFEQFTFTYTANAAWEMLDALPWIAERPYDNNDQIFNRYFAASMAQHIFKQHPNIKKVLTAWAALPNNEDALTSALERNPELKSTLLTATPWLTQANNDSERRRRLAELVNETNINTLLSTAITQLKNNQLEDGSWPWFSGIYSSPHTTMEIITGFGYLHKTGAAITEEDNSVVNRAIEWLHNYLDKEEAELKESKGDTIQDISNDMIKGLYALSFFEGETQRHSFWMSRLEKNLPVDNIQLQSMVATILHRSDNSNLTAEIMQSLEEKLVDGENLTSFYKTTYSPYWYQSPLETHITALEVFREIDPYYPKVQRLENWLIAQKRTQSWRTTRATIGAIYSLAQSERLLFSTENNDVIKVGNNTLKPASEITGLGYFNQTWQKEQIQPKMGHVVIDKKSDTPSWASLHLQYFKDTKEIEEGGFLKTSNLFFKRVISNGTERWEKIEESTKLTKGDRILIQIEVESPQTLDFVHLKSPRASALEPADHLSGYQWNQGVGFYQSITDAGVDFFIDQLPKGRTVLQYESVISMEGNVVNGPSEVSCFYAPEFAGHGSAQTLHIKEE